MSRHSLSILACLTATLAAGLFAREAAAIAVEEGIPFNEIEPTRIHYPTGTLSTAIPIELRVRHSGVTEVHDGECQATLVSQNPPVRRLVCPGLGSADMQLVEQQSAAALFEVDLVGFKLAPNLAGELRGAVLAGDDPVLANGVRVERHWWWGVLCIPEASDSNACDAQCDAIGIDDSRVATVADHTNNQCLAVCQCIAPNGAILTNFVIDAAPF
jgi:hypothetical protein